MGELWEALAIAVLLVAVGAILAAPGVPPEQRLGALAAVVAVGLAMSRIRRHGPN